MTPTPIPADSADPNLVVLVVVYNLNGDQCSISVERAIVEDAAISHGIGAAGVGDRSGYVRLICTSDTGGACQRDLVGGGWVGGPYGAWSGDYRGSSILGGVISTSVITIWVEVRDNAGKFAGRDFGFTNVGCVGGN